MSAPKDTHSLTAYLLEHTGKKAIYDSKQIESLLITNPLLQLFQKNIQYQFKNRELLLTACTHRSFAHEFGQDQLANNEVLEFLGDSILGAMVAILITQQFPQLDEGQLSKMKSSLVSEGPLSELAQVLCISSVILVGRGEFQTNGLQRPSILSSALEAMVAAIFLDSGFSSCQRFLDHVLLCYEKSVGIPFISPQRFVQFDAKTRLQEWTMKKFKSLPEYKTIQHDDNSFTVELVIDGKFIDRITDISKKRAQQQLAQRALDLVNKEGA